MFTDQRFAWWKGVLSASIVIAVIGCGGSATNEKGNNASSASSTLSESSSNNSTSLSVSSESSSEVSEASSSAFSSEVPSSSEAPSSSSSSAVSSSAGKYFTAVKVWNVLDANVKIGEISRSIDAGDGLYEWGADINGSIVTIGGALDFALPYGEATDADPNAVVFSAPEGYGYANPFTTLMVKGKTLVELNATYPAATAYSGEDNLPFNYDMTIASNPDEGGNLQIAKEAGIAALVLSNMTDVVVTSSSSALSTSSAASSVTSSAAASEGGGDSIIITRPESSSSSSVAPTNGDDPFPAALRDAADDVAAAGAIYVCGTVECIKSILLESYAVKFGYFEPACAPLPGVDDCLEYDPVEDNQQSSAASSSAQSSAASSSGGQDQDGGDSIVISKPESSSSSSVAPVDGSDPFPS